MDLVEGLRKVNDPEIKPGNRTFDPGIKGTRRCVNSTDVGVEPGFCFSLLDLTYKWCLSVSDEETGSSFQGENVPKSVDGGGDSGNSEENDGYGTLTEP